MTLGNAWKFTANAAHAEVELGAWVEGEHITYFVRDNGAGFDLVHAGRLFEPFQRMHT